MPSDSPIISPTGHYQPGRDADCVIVGGGIIGLSLAYELSRQGLGVTLLERGQVGREASWAGAGILPPGSWYDDHPLLESLAQASHAMHADWSALLLAETGIDDEHHTCGGWYLPTVSTAEQLEAKFGRWTVAGIPVEHRQPPNPIANASASDAYYLPTECQVRNPRRLAALAKACRQRGVTIVENCEVLSLHAHNNRIRYAVTTNGTLHADRYCITAGCWSDGPLSSIGSAVACRPVRGQMVLLKPTKQAVTANVHQADRYVTTRRDGRVLIGSTLEDVGFDKSTNQESIEELIQFARQVVPTLADATVEATWAGLRPATPDGLPRIGPVPGLANTWAATGHYRAGLLLSPITAVLMAQLINREAPRLPALDKPLDISPFELKHPCNKTNSSHVEGHLSVSRT